MMISEEDRQLVLLSLVTLSRERPGFDYALGEIAEKLSGRGMYDRLKEINAWRSEKKKEIEPLSPDDSILEQMKRYMGV